jgi:hypothetical protein
MEPLFYSKQFLIAINFSTPRVWAASDMLFKID